MSRSPIRVPVLVASWVGWCCLTAASSAQDQKPSPKKVAHEESRANDPAAAFNFTSQGTPLSMVRREEVRKELKLSDEQNKQAVVLAGRLWTGVTFPKREELRKLSRDEQRKKFAEAMQKRNELEKQLQAQLFDLLNESQAKRLKELGVQRRGLLALLDDELAEQLGLDAEQKRKIREAFKSQHSRFVGALEAGKADTKNLTAQERKKQFQELVAKAEEARQAVEKEILDTLTAEQKARFEKLKGARFEFKPFNPGTFPSSNRGSRSSTTPGKPGGGGSEKK